MPVKHKGAPVLIGVLLVLVNFLLHLLWPGSWLAETELLLTVGVIVALLGLLIGEVFG